MRGHARHAVGEAGGAGEGAPLERPLAGPGRGDGEPHVGDGVRDHPPAVRDDHDAGRRAGPAGLAERVPGG